MVDNGVWHSQWQWTNLRIKRRCNQRTMRSAWSSLLATVNTVRKYNGRLSEVDQQAYHNLSSKVSSGAARPDQLSKFRQNLIYKYLTIIVENDDPEPHEAEDFEQHYRRLAESQCVVSSSKHIQPKLNVRNFKTAISRTQSKQESKPSSSDFLELRGSLISLAERAQSRKKSVNMGGESQAITSKQPKRVRKTIKLISVRSKRNTHELQSRQDRIKRWQTNIPAPRQQDELSIDQELEALDLEDNYIRKKNSTKTMFNMPGQSASAQGKGKEIKTVVSLKKKRLKPKPGLKEYEQPQNKEDLAISQPVKSQSHKSRKLFSLKEISINMSLPKRLLKKQLFEKLHDKFSREGEILEDLRRSTKARSEVQYYRSKSIENLCNLQRYQEAILVRLSKFLQADEFARIQERLNQLCQDAYRKPLEQLQQASVVEQYMARVRAFLQAQVFEDHQHIVLCHLNNLLTVF